MKIEKSLVERYYLKEDWTYADIHISEDGALFIRSDYGDYTYKWGSFGDSFKKFLISINNDYLINKLGGVNSYIFDYDLTIKEIKKEIIKGRREGLDNEVVREIWNEIEELEYTSIKDIFYKIIMDTQYFDIICDNDPYNIPCQESINPQLSSFIKELWPNFIAYLKEEIKSL
jgi:hypothetical protein